MSSDAAYSRRAQEENWLPILELAIQEVFEIMLGRRVKPAKLSAPKVKGEFTAMVGLAGALCGILTISCDREAAHQIAKCMLGEVADSEEQVADALGEICNMVAGNFESGSSRMKSASVVAFDRIAGLLRQRDYRLRIEGHTDNAPIHTAQFPSNWELSTARATEIVRLLILRDGFAPERLSAAGYAEYHPVAANASSEGRSMNRRVDIVILGRALAPLPLAQVGRPGQASSSVPAATPEAPNALKPSAGISSQAPVVRTVGAQLKR